MSSNPTSDAALPREGDRPPVGVIGAGSFGTAIANLLAENAQVRLYTRRPGAAEAMRRDRRSAGQALHAEVRPTEDLEALARDCFLLFLVVPSANFAALLDRLAPHLRPDHILIHGTKGLHVTVDGPVPERLERDEVLTMTELIGQRTVVLRSGCLHGPNLAREIADGLPAATVVASRFDEVINEAKAHLRSDRFQVYGSYDVHGIELAGVLKNILAIGSGMVRGLELGENARALMLTRGLSELIHLGRILDIEARAFLGLAGIGDIIATCASPLSRNYTVGYRVAKGEALDTVLASMDEPAEGVHTIRVAAALAERHGVGMPIVGMLHRILFDGAPAAESLQRLMRYRIRQDVDFL